MNSNITKTLNIEKLTAIIILLAVFVYIPYKILSFGYRPTDDTNRHIAFSQTNQTWSDVLVIEPSLSADHNAGWHFTLRTLHKYLGLNKEKLLTIIVVGMFLAFNLTGSLLSSNIASWSIVLLIMFVFDRGIFFRVLSGRPFIISSITALVLYKLWFIESFQQIKTSNKYLITLIFIALAVWLHGTWYTFLILPIALLLSGKLKKSIELCLIILISTVIGSYLTGNFSQFLYFHYANTINIFSEKVYNWQLVSEFAEGNVQIFEIIPTAFIIILLIYSKKITLNELSKDPLFIMVLLCWMLSIKVTRIWFDWGLIALMFWLSYKITDLIKEMQSIKKPVFRWTLFLFIIVSLIVFLANSEWDNHQKRKSFSVDFSNPKFAEYKPLEGGIIYNDAMEHFYYNYFSDHEGKYKYVLGFEPAIMLPENRKIYREISYSGFHYTSYKPWIDKLTLKDRIFTSSDIRLNYPELDWIMAGQKLFIGKRRK